MNLLRQAAGRRASLRSFVARGRISNTIGYSLAGTTRRTAQNTSDDTFVGCGTQAERGGAPGQNAQTKTSATRRDSELNSAEHTPSWQQNYTRATTVCHEKAADQLTRHFRHECLKSGYVGEVPLRGEADCSFFHILGTCNQAKTLFRICAVESKLQMGRRTFHYAAAVQPPFCYDTEHISSKCTLPAGEGRGVSPWRTFHQLGTHTACAAVHASSYDPTHRMLGCFVSDSDFRTERRSGAKPVPALTIAAAAVFAFPLQWGEHKDSSAEDKNTNDSGTAETRDGCAAFHHKTTDYGHEDMNCLRKAAYPGRTTLHAAMLIGRGLGVLQQYFIRVAEQLECANRSVFGGYLQAKDAAHRLWFALQHHLKIVGSAVNQAGELVRLSNEKACGSCGSETMQAVMQAVQGSPSPGKQAVREKDTDGECNIFSGRRSWTAHGAAFYRKALVGSLAAECSSGLQFHPGQPTLFDAHAAYNENEAHKSCGWLMATYNALASFFRTLGSALLRLIYVLPLGITAAIAGFWLLGLPYISACLRTVGLGGNWEAIAQRELEEVIFTAVTAAASAAGPTYVKFLQWIATRPDLFHESLCARCARLQTSVRPFSYPRAALLLREQFGDDVGRHLLLDPTPIGCGCIAQVYRAYLLLSNEASEESKRTFLDHAFVLGGSLSKSAAAEIGRGDKLPPVAVAVKIMRPGVREAMEFDLRMMLLVASVLQYLPAFGFVALKKSVEEFAVAMRRQLDFGLEEKHLKLFRSNFGLSTVPIPGDLLPLRNKCRRASGPRQCETPTVEPKAANYHTNIVNSLSRKILGMRRQVTFPYPFEALSSSEVIVMTLESGFTLNQLFKTRAELQELEEASRDQEKPQGDRGLAATRREQVDTPVASPILAAQKMIERFSSVGMICLHSFLQMVFLDNFFHGDMHSGNLLCRFAHKNKELIFPVLPATLPPRLLTEAPRLDGPLELVVLDCGLAGSLDQADRVNFVTLLEAITRKRGREAALAMLQRAKRSSCQDREGFCSEVEQLIDEHHFEMSHVRFTSLMGHMLSLSKKYCVELDPSFVSIVVAMSVLEGVGAQLCPDADVLKTALPYSLIAAKLINPDSNSEASH